MICVRFVSFTAMLCLVASGFGAEPKAAPAKIVPPKIAPPATAEPKAAKPSPKTDGTVTETEIKAAGDATFDAGNHIATFNGGVTVTDPRFTMKSQKLTVYLVKNRDATAPDDSATSGIERAVAEGAVVIVQTPVPSTKPGEAPEEVSGRSQKATFEPKTGVVVLTGSPIVRRGVNEHIATSAATTMTLTRDGGLRTTGPSKTIIRDTTKAGDLTSTTTKKP
jgi:lipopolysaccharide export system protein LptA